MEPNNDRNEYAVYGWVKISSFPSNEWFSIYRLSEFGNLTNDQTTHGSKNLFLQVKDTFL